MKISLYKHQEDCIDSKKGLLKSLINIWCGGGKTRIIVYSIFDDNQLVNVIVFPSLGLINQFNNDYILCEDFMDYFKVYQCLSVCSDSESKLKIKTDIIRYTTKESIIKNYLKKGGKKLFTVTYQSLEMFMNIIVESGTNINRLYYDEAHHILGSNIQNVVFKNDELNVLIEKTEFYTATPDNKNGITMYDRENPGNSDCGPIAYEYLFYQAVEDGISKDFTMKLMLYPKTKEDMYINLFESIFRECFSGEYNYWNILTFHNMVEEKDDMATVNQLSKKEKLFKKCFLKIIEEYPDKQSIYSVDNVFLKGVGSKTRGREDIITQFDKPENGRIYLLASCKTLGEGIDTKYANMEIPINPGGSLVYEQQKLGRITRNPGGNNPNGIVLIPCWIDTDKYEGLDKYERDDMIRQELHEGGNFNTFLNVMSAYKNQCDPELWELCLKYPKMYSPKEIKDNLDKQGFKVDESKGDLIENVNHIIDKDLSDLVGESDEETIQNIVSTGKQVEVHSQDKDLPIITYGSETDEEPIRLFKDEENVYHPVSKKEPTEPKRKIERPDKLKRKKLVNVHMNDEIKVLWKIDESSFDVNNAFCHGVLDAEIDYNEKRFERWYENLENLKQFIDNNSRKPPSHGDLLGYWLGQQVENHKYNKNIMKYSNIKEKWEEFMNEYSEYFKSNEKIWIEKLNDVKKYIDTNSKLPPSKNNKLNDWLSTQIENYKYNKNIMKNNQEIKVRWEEFIEEYSEYFKSNEEIWIEKLNDVKKYIDTNLKLPSVNGNDKKIKSMGTWISTQKSSYYDNKYIMKNNQDIKIKWEEFMNEYGEYFKNINEIWYENLEKLKEYIDKNEKLPSNSLGGTNYNDFKTKFKTKLTEKEIQEYKLVCWFSSQKGNYKKNQHSMKNIEIKKSWEEFIEEYSEYFKSNEEKWYENLEKLREYIDTNKKLPPDNPKDINVKRIKKWLSNNKKYYINNSCIMNTNTKVKGLWEEFVEEYSEYFKSNEEKWNEKLKDVKKYIDENKRKPSPTDKNEKINTLGIWISLTKGQYNRIDRIMKQPKFRKLWEDFIEEYSEYFTTTKPKKDMSKKEIKPKSKKETTEQKRERTKSEISILHQKYKTMNSQTLHKHFEDNPDDWENYHKISEENEETFPDEEIPYKKVIEYLENIPGKKTKDVADLGCGKARVCEHFSESKRFNFTNMDHVSCNDLVVKQDIKDTGLDDYSMDIVVLSLAMWGSNCKDYITEANRILDENGVLLIIEATKRWTDEETRENKLVKLLEDNNFTIKNINEEKFMFIECIKN
jgi:superfamily II DNA or RNA helicase